MTDDDYYYFIRICRHTQCGHLLAAVTHSLTLNLNHPPAPDFHHSLHSPLYSTFLSLSFLFLYYFYYIFIQPTQTTEPNEHHQHQQQHSQTRQRDQPIFSPNVAHFSPVPCNSDTIPRATLSHLSPSSPLSPSSNHIPPPHLTFPFHYVNSNSNLFIYSSLQ